VVYASQKGTIRFAPDIPCPLISLACLRKNGYSFSNATEGYGELRNEDGKLVMKVPEQSNVLMDAHCMLGHVAPSAILRAAKEGTFVGIDIDLGSARRN